MVSNIRIEEALINEDNPFKRYVVGDVWESCIDVQEINKSVTLKIKNEIDQVKKNRKSTMILIQGQVGMGKTHFLSRIRRIYAEKNAYFFNIRPLPSLMAPYQYFLQEISISMRRQPAPRIESPLLQAFTEIIKCLLREFSDKDFDKKGVKDLFNQIKNNIEDFKHCKIISSNKIQKNYKILINKVVNWVSLNLSEVDLQFIRVLFAVFDSETRNHAIRWLQGDELLNEQLLLLNISQNILVDDIALRVMNSLFYLLPRPVVLSLDQLESVIDSLGERGLTIIFEILVRIHDQIPNTIILLMCQTQLWHDKIEPILKKSTMDRIDSKISLNHPNKEEAMEIVTLRLEEIWKTCNSPPPFPTYPFPPEYLTGLFEHHGLNPRGFLHEISDQIGTFKEFGSVTIKKTYVKKKDEDPVFPAKNLDEFIGELYSKTSDEILEEIPKIIMVERERFIVGNLNILFKTMKNFPVEGVKTEKIILRKMKTKKDIQLEAIINYDNMQKHLMIEVNNSNSAASVLATLKRLKKETITGRTPIFIRDASLPIKESAKKTIEELEEIQKNGYVWFINSDEYLPLETAKRIVAEVVCEGLSFDDKTVEVPAIEDYLARFVYKTTNIIEFITKKSINRKREGSSKEKPNNIDKRNNSIDKQVLAKKMLNLLEVTPVLSVSLISENLGVDKEMITEMVAVLEDNNEINIINKDPKNLLIARRPKLLYK